MVRLTRPSERPHRIERERPAAQRRRERLAREVPPDREQRALAREAPRRGNPRVRRELRAEPARERPRAEREQRGERREERVRERFGHATAGERRLAGREAERERRPELPAEASSSPEWRAPRHERRPHGRWSSTGEEVEGEGGRAAAPAVDVLDRGDAVVVRADLAGFDREAVRLRGTDDTLRIEAEREPDEEATEAERVHRRERATRVERTVELPARTRVEDAAAEFEDGVLEVRLPKRESEREREIEF